ncbi:MAG: ArsR family transcriptional regulator [Nanobdellota archaeon]
MYGQQKDTYIMKRSGKGFVYSPARMLENPESLKVISSPVRIRILSLLSQRGMYPSELSGSLGMNEQKVYYHLKQLHNQGVLEVIEKKEIRGAVAKKYASSVLNFAVSLGDSWEPLSNLKETTTKGERFLREFVRDGQFNGYVVVGSPDPHGSFRAYARDGHYAIDLSMFLGRHCSLADSFSVKLDVDVMNEKARNENLVLVGGPVTNMLVSEVNSHLPVRFSDKRPWGLYSTKTGKHYTDDTVGLIAKIPNPFNREKSIILLAGIRYIGTKAAVMALTRKVSLLLKDYGDSRAWSSVVQGFDLDSDGKIDSVEILE